MLCALNGRLEFRQNCASYQLVKSLYSIANGGFGGTGLGEGTFTSTDGTQLIPALGTDFIYSAIAQELGLIGAAALLLCYMVFVARGMRIALRAQDGFSKLLAVGLTFGFALQTFVIVGGVLRIVPLTGITLPFVSYGGHEHRGELPAARGAPARLEQGELAAMNRQIIRLTYVALGLVGVLVVMTTYWQTWAAAGLADRQDNAIKRVAEFSVDRGLIFSWKPRKRLARNIERDVEQNTLFFRRYPYGPLAPHLVGYSTVGRSRTGLERSLNDYLTSSNANLSTLVDKALDELRGKPVEGNDVVTNLDLEAQEVALDELGTQCGAVVVLDPRTGKVRVMASTPTFDPNQVENNFGQIERIEADCRPAAPLLNRASAGLYVPGSTFKVITAAAALESKKFKPESSFVDPGYCTVYGKRVNNFDTTSPFGTVDLVTALTYSVNSVFCNIGKALGAKRILDTAKRFGFYERPPLETPSDERQASGLYQGGRLYYPKLDSDVDAGRMAFGQERMLVTPLQMAMVAGTIGVGGKLMEPQAVDKIVGPGGKILLRQRPALIRQAVSRDTADEVAAMMRLAVARGTGTAAQLPGYSVGGKTGTGETGVPGSNTTWFIAFAGRDEESPAELAIAVVLQNQAGTGGATAAPIARAVMQAILP